MVRGTVYGSNINAIGDIATGVVSPHLAFFSPVSYFSFSVCQPCSGRYNWQQRKAHLLLLELQPSCDRGNSTVANSLQRINTVAPLLVPNLSPKNLGVVQQSMIYVWLIAYYILSSVKLLLAEWFRKVGI